MLLNFSIAFALFFEFDFFFSNVGVADLGDFSDRDAMADDVIADDVTAPSLLLWGTSAVTGEFSGSSFFAFTASKEKVVPTFSGSFESGATFRPHFKE